MSIGENIIRTEQNLSRNDLARKMAGTTDRNKVKVENSKLARIERNDAVNPGVYTLQSIAMMMNSLRGYHINKEISSKIQNAP